MTLIYMPERLPEDERHNVRRYIVYKPREWAIVRQLAVMEHRTAAAMTRVLVLEALHARAQAAKQNKA